MRQRTPVKDRFWSKVDRTSDCWIWKGALKANGYGTFGVGRVEGNRYAHRFSYELAYGAIPDGLHVCHRCDVRACVRPDHLFLGTRIDNQQDMVTKGRSLWGERHNLAVLTADDVLRIRQRWATGGSTQTEIAADFRTTKGNVSQIVRGKKWRHLLPEDWVPPPRARWSRPQ